jgi:hypothetical protein
MMKNDFPAEKWSKRLEVLHNFSSLQGFGLAEHDQLLARTKSGETIPIEVLSFSEENQMISGANSTTETPNDGAEIDLNGNNKPDQANVLSELHNLAKEFPSCANYLIQELDKRR